MPIGGGKRYAEQRRIGGGQLRNVAGDGAAGIRQVALMDVPQDGEHGPWRIRNTAPRSWRSNALVHAHHLPASHDRRRPGIVSTCVRPALAEDTHRAWALRRLLPQRRGRSDRRAPVFTRRLQPGLCKSLPRTTFAEYHRDGATPVFVSRAGLANGIGRDRTPG